MGSACDRICARIGITRKEQDDYALRSHHLAHKATEDGTFLDEVMSVAPPPHFKSVSKDNGIRGDSTDEKMAKLRPAFDGKYGVVTAANASFLTDGAGAVLLMGEDTAKELGFKPKAYIVSYAFMGTDPLEEMLLGQTYATPIALARAGLTFEDLGVLEIHEAFAGQMMATIRLLEDKAFAASLGLDRPIAKKVNWDILNIHGGSLSIGHPFGATGARLIHTCANRLQRENKRYGLVAACALSGLGNATILERA
jgi:acetyl-CoA acetyltransferase family protein